MSIQYIQRVAGWNIGPLQPFNGLVEAELHQFRALLEVMELTPGGLDETSYTTRFTPAISLVMREEILLSTSGGKSNLHAVCTPKISIHRPVDG